VSQSTLSSGTETVSTIIDETGPRGGSVNRNVDHIVTKTKIIPFSYESNPYLIGFWYDDYLEAVLRTKNATAFGAPPPSVFGTLSPVDLSDFYSNFLSRQLEQIPTVLSVPNFLLDIDDIGKLATPIKQLQGFGYRSIKDLKLALGTRSGRTNLLSRFTEYGANVHLAYQFGVKPLISDIKNSLKVVEKVQRRIAYLKRTAGKKIKIRGSKGFDLSLNSEPNFIPGTPYYRKWIAQKATVNVGVGLEVIQNLQGLDDTGRLLAAYAAATGFNKPLSVLYDAVSFSFLADYVSNVSQLFSSLAFEPFEGKITALDGWSSTKTEFQASLVVGVPPTTGGSNFVSTHVACEWQQKVYTRRRGVPSNQGLVFDTKLSGTQAANIVALIRQALG
jgi:hypothetical protein